MLRVPSVIGEAQSGHTGGVLVLAALVRRPLVVSRRIHALQAPSVHFHTGTLMRGSAGDPATDEVVRAVALPGPGTVAHAGRCARRWRSSASTAAIPGSTLRLVEATAACFWLGSLRGDPIGFQQEA